MSNNKLDFAPLDKANGHTELEGDESAVRRWQSREPNPTVQMSIRMQASAYDGFRALCKRERRTNGEMLDILVKSYNEKQA